MTRTPLVVGLSLLAIGAAVASLLANFVGAGEVAAVCLGAAIGLVVTAWSVA